jgi:PIN domain nuclease of toxin-antitoxin system
MNLLLDTHTFIWWDSEPSRLSAPAFAAISDPANQLMVNAASLWEIQIKHAIDKLTLRLPLHELVEHQQATNDLQLLSITSDHVFGLYSLPAIHKDPFDRLLVAQANYMGASLVSVDPIFQSYPVSILW